jgi:hypothetical protein
VIGDFEAIVELKCPKSATHLSYLRSSGSVPAAHVAQMTHHLYVSGAAVCHFFSYDPRFPEPLRTFHATLTREQADLGTYHREVETFLAECDRELESLMSYDLGRTA